MRLSSGVSPHPAMPLYTSPRGFIFLAPRWRMPLELCTSATIDFAVIFFINSMEIGGTVWGASLPYFKKKLLPSLE